MFKTINCEQRSEEWVKARLGKWTASNFDKALTASGKPSAQVEEIINRLVAEVVLGQPDQTFQSSAMERGTELEDEALAYANFVTGSNFQKVGMLDSGEGCACSPDAVDFEKEIGLEMKCPLPHTHVKYLSSGELPDQYLAQVQGSMMVTGWKGWAFLSYCPGLPDLYLVIKRDDEYIEKLRAVVQKGCIEVNNRVEKIKKLM